MDRQGRFSAILFTVLLLAAPACAQGGACYDCWMNPQTGCQNCLSGGSTGWGCESVGCESCDILGTCTAFGGRGCFVGDVAISTPEGAALIKDLDVGDVVLSRNAHGAIVSGRVVDTHLTESLSYLIINDRLKVTDSHPFYSGGEWILAGDLAIGDLLTDTAGSSLVVGSIERVHKGVRVYNISVDGHETFFAEGIYVHNKAPVPAR